MNEHEFEPVPGLPAVLPQGEQIVWQGAPARKALARHAFHVRGVSLYFAILIVWQGLAAETSGGPAGQWLAALTPTLAGAVIGLAILHLLAWLNARSTLYTLTNRRLVMRFGVAIPMTVNIPFSKLEAANLREHGDGTGDLALTLVPNSRISYLVFWPHVRPWHFGRAQPTLRAVGGPQRVASLLREAAMGSPVAAAETQSQWASSTP
ncbi:MAG: PH domain-containing protein [Gammaproteobacteria bacterium]|nr:PH domain-containing protein [Gammaproteobacteria bacterium]